MMKRVAVFLAAIAAASAVHAATVMPIWQNDTNALTISFNDTFGHQVPIGSYNPLTGGWSVSPGSISLGQTFTGGLISVGGSPCTTAPCTFALTVAGTSGGIPYFSSNTTWASSAVLTANAIILGGGAGTTPSTPVGLGTVTQLLHGNAAGAPSFGPISSADVSTVLASAPPIATTNLSASGVVSGAGFTNLFASPPCIGCTAPGAITASTLTSNNIISTELPGLTSNVASSGFPGMVGSNWFLYNSVSVLAGNAAISTLRVDRVPTGTGGSNSMVPTALLVRDSPPATDSFFEWTVNAQNYNSALATTGAENVGVAGSIFKIGAATQVGASWGGFFQAIDQTGVASPIGGTIGMEADSGTFGLNGGTDPNKQRVIAQFDCTGLSGTHCGRGVLIIPQTAGVMIDSAITVASDPAGTIAFNVTGAGAVTAAGLIDASTAGLKTPSVANGTVATVLGSLGPVGSHTTVQEWIEVQGAGGVVRYVPGF